MIRLDMGCTLCASSHVSPPYSLARTFTEAKSNADNYRIMDDCRYVAPLTVSSPLSFQVCCKIRHRQTADHRKRDTGEQVDVGWDITRVN